MLCFGILFLCLRWLGLWFACLGFALLLFVFLYCFDCGLVDVGVSCFD